MPLAQAVAHNEAKPGTEGQTGGVRQQAQAIVSRVLRGSVRIAEPERDHM